MGFDFNSISDNLGRNADALDSQIRDFSKTMNPNSQQDMLKLQSMMQKWTIAVNLESTMVKSVSDVVKSVIQKF